MLSLNFLNPAYLAALGLGSIPILIHLIRRRRVRIIPWAAWEFLNRSHRVHRKRFRIEQILLLLLRILIILLVVLAFCRPVLRVRGAAATAPDARIHALIVLDNSYSMGYRVGNGTAFDQAKRAAQSLFHGILKEGDTVQVLLASAHPEALIREPTYNLQQAASAINAAPLGDQATDYGTAAAFCLRMLQQVRNPVREVYWFTDSQRSGFETRRRGDASVWAALTRVARVTWVDMGGPLRTNRSVSAPTFSRELILRSVPVRISAAIHNYSFSAQTGTLVHLEVDGRRVASSRVDLPAHGAAPVQFVYLFDAPGMHVGSIRLDQPDALPRDDVAWFAVRVRPRISVLVVDGYPSQDPARDEAFYITTALTPAGPSMGASAGIVATVRPVQGLRSVNLSNFDVVVVAGLEAINASDVPLLTQFVRRGGGLLLFPGRNGSQGPAAGALLKEALIPARVGIRRTAPADAPVSLDAASMHGAAVGTFRDTSQIDIGSARFTGYNDLAPAAAPDVRVAARFSDGRPALVERRVGSGRVMLAAFSAGVYQSDLPYKAAYVPLVHQIASYLAAGGTERRNVAVGEPIAAHFGVADAGSGFLVTKPDGASVKVRGELGLDGVTVPFTGTRSAGAYWVGTPGHPRIQAFAVNLPEAEADPASVDDAAIKRLLGPAGQVLHGGRSMPAAVRQARSGAELWLPLVAAAIPLLFLEGLLGRKMGRRG
ncbi:MAG: BatA domain-containing protein [Chthonomonadales bacterium]